MYLSQVWKYELFLFRVMVWWLMGPYSALRLAPKVTLKASRTSVQAKSIRQISSLKNDVLSKSSSKYEQVDQTAFSFTLFPCPLWIISPRIHTKKKCFVRNIANPMSAVGKIMMRVNGHTNRRSWPQKWRTQLRRDVVACFDSCLQQQALLNNWESTTDRLLCHSQFQTPWFRHPQQVWLVSPFSWHITVEWPFNKLEVWQEGTIGSQHQAIWRCPTLNVRPTDRRMSIVDCASVLFGSHSHTCEDHFCRKSDSSR